MTTLVSGGFETVKKWWKRKNNILSWSKTTPKRLEIKNFSQLQCIIGTCTEDLCVIGVVGAKRSGKSSLLNWMCQYLKRNSIGPEEHEDHPTKGDDTADGDHSTNKDDATDDDHTADDDHTSYKDRTPEFSAESGSRHVTDGVWIASSLYDAIKIEDGREKRVKVLFLDFEGFFDSGQDDNQLAILFCVAWSLCSTVIYKVKGEFNSKTLKDFALISQQARRLQQIIRQKQLVILVSDWDLTDQYGLEGGGQVMQENYDEATAENKRAYDYITELFQPAHTKQSCRIKVFLCPGPKNPAVAKVGKLGNGENEMGEDFTQSIYKFFEHVFDATGPYMLHDVGMRGKKHAEVCAGVVQKLHDGAADAISGTFQVYQKLFRTQAEEDALQVFEQNLNPVSGITPDKIKERYYSARDAAVQKLECSHLLESGDERVALLEEFKNLVRQRKASHLVATVLEASSSAAKKDIGIIANNYIYSTENSTKDAMQSEQAAQVIFESYEQQTEKAESEIKKVTEAFSQSASDVPAELDTNGMAEAYKGSVKHQAAKVVCDLKAKSSQLISSIVEDHVNHVMSGIEDEGSKLAKSNAEILKRLRELTKKNETTVLEQIDSCLKATNLAQDEQKKAHNNVQQLFQQFIQWSKIVPAVLDSKRSTETSKISLQKLVADNKQKIEENAANLVSDVVSCADDASRIGISRVKDKFYEIENNPTHIKKNLKNQDTVKLCFVIIKDVLQKENMAQEQVNEILQRFTKLLCSVPRKSNDAHLEAVKQHAATVKRQLNDRKAQLVSTLVTIAHQEAEAALENIGDKCKEEHNPEMLQQQLGKCKDYKVLLKCWEANVDLPQDQKAAQNMQADNDSFSELLKKVVPAELHEKGTVVELRESLNRKTQHVLKQMHKANEEKKKLIADHLKTHVKKDYKEIIDSELCGKYAKLHGIEESKEIIHQAREAVLKDVKNTQNSRTFAAVQLAEEHLHAKAQKSEQNVEMWNYNKDPGALHALGAGVTVTGVCAGAGGVTGGTGGLAAAAAIGATATATAALTAAAVGGVLVGVVGYSVVYIATSKKGDSFVDVNKKMASHYFGACRKFRWWAKLNGVKDADAKKLS